MKKKLVILLLVSVFLLLLRGVFFISSGSIIGNLRVLKTTYVYVYPAPQALLSSANILCKKNQGELLSVFDKVYVKDALYYQVECEKKVGYVLHENKVLFQAKRAGSI